MITGGQTIWRRTAAAAITMATALSLSAGPAFAESTTVKDSKGDVWIVPDEGEGKPTKAGSVVNADVRRLVVTHGAKNIVLTATFADLKAKRGRAGLAVFLETSNGIFVSMSGVIRGPRATERFAYQTVSTESTGRCPDRRLAVNLRRDRMRLTLPRDCIRDPKWVRFEAYGYFVPPQGGPSRLDAVGTDKATTKESAKLFTG